MQSGKCKLDLGKNPIIQVTPLGSLPQVTSQGKVEAWLHPAEPETKKKNGYRGGYPFHLHQGQA